MKTRNVIKHNESGDSTVDMMDLKIGDKFTITEPDGTYVGAYIADDSPYYNDDEIATIECTLIINE
jgi:hypothetical protein